MTTTSGPGLNLKLIIPIVVVIPCFIILVVVVIVAVCCCCRKKKQKAKIDRRSSILLAEKEGTENSAFSVENERQDVFTELPELPSKPIKVKSDLLRHIEEHQQDMSKYRAEFNMLPGSGIKNCSVAKKAPGKNRYINILPFNDNRVCLTAGSDSDYINASFVDGYRKEKSYIAAQGPMESTVLDFWQMIWDQNCNRIIMVTRTFEGEKLKCSEYWPAAKESAEAKYGKICVRTLKEEPGDDFMTRTLHVKNGDTKRVIYQFQFITWPDQDVPDTCTSMLKFYQLCFRTELEHPATGPILIHCSAGVGRTGTMIALDILIQQAEQEKIVDIQRCLDKLRRQRVNMVQSTAQYIFLHHSLLEYLTLGNVEIKNADFKKTYSDLQRSEERSGTRLIQQQFNVLNALKPQFLPVLYSLANAEMNQSKNRNTSVLPVDSYLPLLKSLDEAPDNYINAVYVHGFRQVRPYIATQMPMPGTTLDFWRLIRDNNAAAIVMLNDLGKNEQYWPEDGRTVTVGSFDVSNIGEIATDNILVTDLKIVYKGNTKVAASRQDSSTDSEPITPSTTTTENLYMNTAQRPPSDVTTGLQVRHIRVLDWPTGSSFPKSRTTLIELYQQVQLCMAKNREGRVIVHCLYGAERSGLFCAAMNMMDEITRDCAVDVFNSVKRVRRTRPEFIRDKEQYKYLYEMASTYLSLLEEEDYSEVYANTARL